MCIPIFASLHLGLCIVAFGGRLHWLELPIMTRFFMCFWAMALQGGIAFQKEFLGVGWMGGSHVRVKERLGTATKKAHLIPVFRLLPNLLKQATLRPSSKWHIYSTLLPCSHQFSEVEHVVYIAHGFKYLLRTYDPLNPEKLLGAVGVILFC